MTAVAARRPYSVTGVDRVILRVGLALVAWAHRPRRAVSLQSPRDRALLAARVERQRDLMIWEASRRGIR